MTKLETQFKKGEPPPKHKEKCCCFRCSEIPYWLGKKREDMTDNKHYMWKGDSSSYTAVHQWIRRKMGKATCCSKNKNHKSKKFHWGNKSGEYKRDISDWHQLCSSCNHKDGIKIHKRYNI